MSTIEAPVGVDHLTVVPENAEANSGTEATEDAA
jgi:hypothetical protein